IPRIALDETLAAVWIGLPIRCLEPPPVTSRGVLAMRASESTRDSSRSSMGRTWEWTATAASRRPILKIRPEVPRRLGLAAVEREDLGRVQEPLGVEHRLDAHLQGEVDRGELHPHQVALLDADAVLAGEAAADVDAQLEDLGACFLGPLGLTLVVGVVEDERMQVAVAGVEDVGHPEAVAVADRRDLH